MTYVVEEWRGGLWTELLKGVSLAYAAEILNIFDTEQAPCPRRVIGREGIVFSGRHCSRDTPVNDVKPIWIVMSLDKPGPCERDGAPYRRHDTKTAARSEARRLSVACGGGRFGVLELVHVVGWIDFELVAEIPF